MAEIKNGHGRKGGQEKKKPTTKCRSSGELIRAGSKINYEVLMLLMRFLKALHVGLMLLQLKLSTGKDGAICKTPALACNVQQDSARIAFL